MSNAAAAVGIAQKTGLAIEPEFLRQLRDGGKTSATAADLAGIAEFFGVSASYLTDREPDPKIEAQLNLLQAMRDARVRDVRLCGGSELTNILARLIASLDQ